MAPARNHRTVSKEVDRGDESKQLTRRVRPACISADRRIWRIWFSRVARSELRAVGICLCVAEAPLPCGVRRGYGEQPANGVLSTSATRTRCARTRRRGAAGRCELESVGLCFGKGGS